MSVCYGILTASPTSTLPGKLSPVNAPNMCQTKKQCKWTTILAHGKIPLMVLDFLGKHFDSSFGLGAHSSGIIALDLLKCAKRPRCYANFDVPFAMSLERA